MFFWFLELNDFLKRVKEINSDKSDSIFGAITTTIKLLFALPLLLPLALDMFATTWLSNGFNFGTLGGVIGLFMSNLLSGFIIFTTYRLKL